MFGGSINPATELTALVDGSVAGSSLGFGDLGAPANGSVTAAVTTPILGSQVINGVTTSIVTGATITINTNITAPWIAGYPDTLDLGSGSAGQNIYRAITLIHELGHFYADVTGMGGSAIVDDGSGTPPGTSQANTYLVYQNCFSDAAYRSLGGGS
jgi:hypothetical protein